MFRATYLQQDLTPTIVATDLAMGRPFTQLYFVYVIIGLYLVTPLLRPFTERASRQQLSVAAGALLGVAALDTASSYALDAGTRVNGLTYWVLFLGFYIAGRALIGLRLTRTASLVLAATVLVIIGGQILAVFVLAVSGDGSWQLYPQSYGRIRHRHVSPDLRPVRSGDAASASVRRVRHRVAALAAATYGVFLIHEMLLYWYAGTFVSGSPELLVAGRIPRTYSRWSGAS